MNDKIEACKTCKGTGIEYDGAGHTCTACNGIAAPVVERQPIGRVSYIGNGFIRARCIAPPPLETLIYTAPPELAELQATIARLTADLKIRDRALEIAAEHADDLQVEIERLKGEPVALTVWEGAMPESNGKSNFTVILHTGDLTEGICVYRSEYPDRARYEADCFRHLIGDPAFPEKPFICDYDADKHSGYVKPDTSQPAPVSVVLPERFEHEHSGCFLSERQHGWNACLDKVKELNQ